LQVKKSANNTTTTHCTINFYTVMLTERACVPAGVTSGQLKDVLLNLLRSNPAQRHRPGVELAMMAFAEAWPCADTDTDSAGAAPAPFSRWPREQ
jgi:hypothetical protein